MESSTSTHPASDATQETAVETRKHWTVESAIQWGGRNGLDGQRLTELHEFASLIKTVEISSSDLKGAVTLDSGSFGTIEKSSLNGTTVAVKRFIKAYDDYPLHNFCFDFLTFVCIAGRKFKQKCGSGSERCLFGVIHALLNKASEYCGIPWSTSILSEGVGQRSI